MDKKKLSQPTSEEADLLPHNTKKHKTQETSDLNSISMNLE